MADGRRIAIGMENYKEIIEKNCYYVDKTLFIRDLLDKGGKVNLFTRPRRFGKTLMLSMLRTFFELNMDYAGEKTDQRRYFDGMKIMQEGDQYVRHMGRYPVINLSLKSAKQPDFAMARHILKDEITGEFARHRYILRDREILTEADREKYRRIMDRKASDADYVTSLKFLSGCLCAYHKEKVIILLDEYDVPLENAYFSGFYDRMAEFIRSLFESALKTNDSLEFAVVTGCLRISRESIFTGLNNLKIDSVLHTEFGEYFGFIQSEVEEMLIEYCITEKEEEIKKWYDGYLFGKSEVYNPWSVLNYVETAIHDRNAFPRPYWSNTSSNSIVRELVEKADTDIRRELECLVTGGVIEKPIHEDLTYGDISQSQDNLWNFLFFTGYLKVVKEHMETDTIYLTMEIPNVEIRYIYRNTIQEYFKETLKRVDFTEFYQNMKQGKEKEVENFISAQLATSISYYDSAESFYHGYMAGILSRMDGYEIHSNKEYGNGRPDLVLLPFNPAMPAIIIELKRAEKFIQMEGLCDAALDQIENRAYEREFLEEGYRKIIKYGICFCKKNCMVKRQKEENSEKIQAGCEN